MLVRVISNGVYMWAERSCSVCVKEKERTVVVSRNPAVSLGRLDSIPLYGYGLIQTGFPAPEAFFRNYLLFMCFEGS
jgi:hypothetical protein